MAKARIRTLIDARGVYATYSETRANHLELQCHSDTLDLRSWPELWAMLLTLPWETVRWTSYGGLGAVVPRAAIQNAYDTVMEWKKAPSRSETPPGAACLSLADYLS